MHTCDIEAAMAHAMSVMADFSKVARGVPLEEQRRWEEMAKEGQKRARSMFVDGWYRDFDSRNNKPIIIENYFDVMMLTPLTVGLATPEQMEKMRPRLAYFQKNPLFWLEWPSFMYAYAEAVWNAGGQPDWECHCCDSRADVQTVGRTASSADRSICRQKPA